MSSLTTIFLSFTIFNNIILSVPAITSITCTERFYPSSGSNRFSTVLSRTKLVQMVRCPKNCNVNAYNIQLYGTGVYTDFSSICYAAIHDGKIPGNEPSIKDVRTKSRKIHPLLACPQTVHTRQNPLPLDCRRILWRAPYKTIDSQTYRNSE